jgi:hypothetical protein
VIHVDYFVLIICFLLYARPEEAHFVGVADAKGPRVVARCKHDPAKDHAEQQEFVSPRGVCFHAWFYGNGGTKFPKIVGKIYDLGVLQSFTASAPWRDNAGVIVTTPCRGLSLSRYARCCGSCLRCGWPRGRAPRAGGRVQGTRRPFIFVASSVRSLEPRTRWHVLSSIMSEGRRLRDWSAHCN